MTRDGAIAAITAHCHRGIPVQGTAQWAAELLDELEPHIQARITENADDREAALAWAARGFKDVEVEYADVLGDVVLHLAERYHQYLRGKQ